MKQLTHTLTSDVAPAVPARRVPSYACATARGAWFGLGSDATRPSSLEQTTFATKGRFASLHGANRLMVIPTNGHRRPPETPT